MAPREGDGMLQDDADRLRLMRDLFPGTAAAIDAAYASHSGERHEATFDEWLDARALEVLPGATGLSIGHGETAALIDRAFAAARWGAERLGVSLPEIEAFSEAGTDLARLADAMIANPSLTPVPAPYGLGERRWVNAFDTLSSPRLVVADEASREFSILDSIPVPAPPTVRAPGAVSHESVRWTLRLIPAEAGPSLLGLSFAHGPHVSLPEMLMLQLMRAGVSEPLLDATSFTWLAGPLAQGRLAARHVYDAAEQTIRITCREVVSQGPHLGARQPVDAGAPSAARGS